MTSDEISALKPRQPEWLRRKERGSVTLIRAMVMLALALGRPAARGVLSVICAYFLAATPSVRAVSRKYLTRALGRRAGITDVFRHYYAFAACVLDRLFLLRNRIDLFDLHIHDEAIVDDLIARNSGCILLGAHLGSFEVLRAASRGKPTLRVKFAMFEENARKAKAVFDAIDPALAGDIIGLGRPGSFLSIQQSLEDGHFVGVLADRSLTDDRPVMHDFLGAPARFSADPFRMIAVLQKPVVLMIGLYRGGNRYDLHFETLVGAGELPRRASPEDLDRIVGRYVARLEHYCRIAPYNWFNFFDIWD
jgi:predicted LPLAT superfamily acyltransferase